MQFSSHVQASDALDEAKGEHEMSERPSEVVETSAIVETLWIWKERLGRCRKRLLCHITLEQAKARKTRSASLGAYRVCRLL